MNKKLLAVLLVWSAIAAGVVPVWASTPVIANFSRISFDTVNGDKVIVSMNQDKVDDIEVSIHGQKISIPKTAYEDLAGPVLNNTVLVVSFGNSGDAAYQLEFSLADPSKDYVATDDMALVSFLIENNKLVERDIYQNKTRTKLLSSIKFNK